MDAERDDPPDSDLAARVANTDASSSEFNTLDIGAIVVGFAGMPNLALQDR